MDDATLATLRAELAERHGIVLTGEQLGKGSFGVVVKAYLAGDEDARRAPLAVKFLTPVTADEALRHLETLPSLALDAPSARALLGCCVLPFVRFGVLDGGAHAPAPFLVSRYIHSSTDSFRDFVTARGTDMAVVQRYVGCLLRALAWAEEHGLVHRDVKPRNVLWDSAARVAYLADWGLVDVETALARADPDQPLGDGDVATTGGGGGGVIGSGRDRSSSSASASSSNRVGGGDDADERGHPALAAFARAVEAERRRLAATAASSSSGGAGCGDRDRDRRSKGSKRPTSSLPTAAAERSVDDDRSGSGREPAPARVDPRSEPSSSARDGSSNDNDSAAAAAAASSTSSSSGGSWPKVVERTVTRTFRVVGGSSGVGGNAAALTAATGTSSAPALGATTAPTSPPALSPLASTASTAPATQAAGGVVDFPAVLQSLPEPLADGASAAASAAGRRGDGMWARHPDEQDAHALRVLDREVRAQERAAAEAAGKRGPLAPAAGSTFRGVACKRALEELGMNAHGRRVARKAGTPGFRPPEVLLGSSYQTSAVDAWSAGMIALCLLARRYPLLPGRDDWVHLHCLHRLWGPGFREAASAVGRHVIAWPTGPELGPVAPNPVAGHLPLVAPDMAAHPAFPAAFDLMLRLAHPDPARRITASAAIAAHPFLTTPVDGWGAAGVPRPLSAAAVAAARGGGSSSAAAAGDGSGDRTGATFDAALLSRLTRHGAPGADSVAYPCGGFATRHGVSADVIPWDVVQLAAAYCTPAVAAGVVAIVAEERRRAAAAGAPLTAASSSGQPRARRREERKPAATGAGAGGGDAPPPPSATVTVPSATMLVDDGDNSSGSDSDDGLRGGRKPQAHVGGGDASTAGSGSAVRGRDGARAQAEDAARLAAEFEERGGEDAVDDEGGGSSDGGARRGAGAAGGNDGSSSGVVDANADGDGEEGGHGGAGRHHRRRLGADATATAASASAAAPFDSGGGASESY